MDKDPKPSEVDALLEGSELMTLVDLQKFIAGELSDSDSETSFVRAFTPLTDGLGLSSPVKKEGPTPPTTGMRRGAVIEVFDMEPVKPPSMQTMEQAPAKFFAEEKSPEATRLEKVVQEKRRIEIDDEIAPTEKLAAKSLAAAIDGPAPTLAAEITAAPVKVRTSAVQPPPVPGATFVRRLLAGVLDEFFVLTTAAIAIAITANVLSPEAAPLDLKQFTNPVFVRFAIMEFACIWLAYLAIGVGVLDMTFGMWVWGLRVRYGNVAGPDTDAKFLKKVARVVFSFCFFAPLAPTLILAIRVRGRNLLDWMTGAVVYRSAV